MTIRSSADVIVVGGGPAGVAASLVLRRQGIRDVMLLDREPSLGGATRHCSHSPFGMLEYRRVYFGGAYGRRLEADARAAGVDVRTGCSVVSLDPGGNITVTTADGVARLSARRVLVATGTRETPRSARLLPGDRPIGVLTTGALQAYVAFHGMMPFKRPLIVGSELVSFSAILTCLGHGARPVAMLEPGPDLLARRPLGLFPRLSGIPVLTGAEIVDIRGASRVESVVVRTGETVRTFECDGVLLTGQFTPEAALFQTSAMGTDIASRGPAVDQFGRCLDPAYFAAGNVLRPVETGGWSFREGHSIGLSIARDLEVSAGDQSVVPVSIAAPIRLVVPNLLRRNASEAALRFFQLRVDRSISGALVLKLDGRSVWSKHARFLPERRILVPIPAAALQADRVALAIEED